MTVKIKLSEVAKDFGIPGRTLLELMGRYGKAPRSTSASLGEEELNMLFDAITQAYEVDDMEAAFEAVRQAKLAAEKEIEDKRLAEEAAAREAEERRAAEEKAAREEEERKKAEEAARLAEERRKAAEKKASAGRSASRDGRDRSRRSDGRQQRRDAPPAQKGQNQPAQPQQPPQAQKPSQPTPPPQRTEPRVRRVDTRGASVNLDKYDERLDTLAPTAAERMERNAGKQKIKQNSQRRSQYGNNKRRQEEQEKMRRLQAQAQAKKVPLKVLIPDEISVGELAMRLKKTAAVVIKELMKMGIMASVSQTIDFDTASLVAMELGAEVEKEVIVTIEEKLIDESEDRPEDLQERSPVVVVMGHVDHGKTSLLDAIRNTNVASGEAGGITQHIGASVVQVGDKSITFLDTPGHAAFTSMRARGAQVTDIAILIVAADDGVMPQTIEAIHHAKAAGVPIIVAINKMDMPGADPDRIMQQLTEYELVPEEWGGSTVVCRISAKTGEGIENLLEMVLLTAEMMELKANPNRAAKGSVIEARLDRGRGPIATVLVQNGTLKAGDIVIAGTAVGRVRAMTDDKGRKATSAGPSTPVEIIGLGEVPAAGDPFYAVEDERMARELAEQRRAEEKERNAGQVQKVTLENLFSQIEQGNVKTLNIIVKADVQGSAEAIQASLEKLSNEEVQVKVIHAAPGGINESDVMLAAASGAIIVGFNVRPDANAVQNAARDHVDIRLYSVIYNCIEEIEQAMKGMLAPRFREAVIGHAEIRQIFRASGNNIAGAYVTDGKMQRSEKVRIVRDSIVIHEGNLATLRRFKDDVREVATGYECGMSFERYNDIRVGDVVEAFVMEQVMPE